MKKHLLSFALFLGLVAATAEPSLAARTIVGQEQRHDNHDKDYRKGQRAAHDPQKRLDAMAKELDLSSKQKDKVARIFQEHQQQMQVLRGQSGQDRSQHKAQAQDIRQSTDQKLKDVLSKKQYAQLEARRPGGCARWATAGATNSAAASSGAPPAAAVNSGSYCVVRTTPPRQSGGVVSFWVVLSGPAAASHRAG